MIKTLIIKDFVLIEELQISFDKGLNVLIGETGSGKSIIIDAIDLSFGARASKDQIRTGASKSLIELTIHNNMKIIPEEIKYLTNLKKLNLLRNCILYIPKEIKYLTNLKHLDLSFSF